jgi:hypothetical protein
LAFELSSGHTVVEVVEQPTGLSFQKKISPDYYSHLIWIQQESIGSTDRCRWLWNTLDCFAEELRHAPHDIDLSWRSASLNPLLVRAFYEIPDENPKEIESRVRDELVTRNLLVGDWERFYMELDVILSVYDGRWTPIRSLAAQPNATHPAEEKSTTKQKPPAEGGVIMRIFGTLTY